MVLLIFPLGYQLEEGYPFHPEIQFERFCEEEALSCLNLLRPFKNLDEDGLFLGRHKHHVNDIWHLSERGHKAAAQAIEAYLKGAGLITSRR